MAHFKEKVVHLRSAFTKRPGSGSGLSTNLPEKFIIIKVFLSLYHVTVGPKFCIIFFLESYLKGKVVYCYAKISYYSYKAFDKDGNLFTKPNIKKLFLHTLHFLETGCKYIS